MRLLIVTCCLFFFRNILKIITFFLVYVNISCIFTSELKTTTKK